MNQLNHTVMTYYNTLDRHLFLDTLKIDHDNSIGIFNNKGSKIFCTCPKCTLGFINSIIYHEYIKHITTNLERSKIFVRHIHPRVMIKRKHSEF